MIAVNITGFKNTGKTTLTAMLAEELTSRGLTVAALKSSHHGYSISDKTDSEHLHKHSDISGGFYEDRTVLQFKKHKSIAQIAPHIDADILLVEGGKSIACMPRIVTISEESDKEALCPELTLDTSQKKPASQPTKEKVTSLADTVMKRGFLLPDLNCGGCGREDCKGLAEDIVSGKATVEDCVALHGEISIDVDGTPLHLNPFVSDIFRAGISGMLSQLKGYRKGKVTITIKNNHE